MSADPRVNDRIADKNYSNVPNADMACELAVFAAMVGAHNANRPMGYFAALRRRIGRHSIRTSNLAIGLVRGF